jgi:phage-related protein
VIEGVSTAIQTAVQTATDIVQTAITTAWSVIVAASENDFGRVPEILSKAWDDIKKTFNTGVEEVKKIFNGVIGDLKKIGTDLANTALGIGSDIIDGIKKGISNGVGALKDAVKNAANDALNAAKRTLGIASPSKAFAELGGFTMQGMALGVARESPKAVSAVSGAMRSVVGAATKVAQAGAKSLAGTGAPASAGDMLAGLNDFVAEFLATAQSFSMKAVRGAQGFADTVGKILAVIGPAVEALGSLRTMVAPTHESVNAFGAALAYVLGEMIVTTYSFGKKSIAAAAASTPRNPAAIE